jgi:hypothetical protein
MTEGNPSPRDQFQACGFYYLIACNILYCACSSQSRIIGYCNILIDIECARGLCQSKGSSTDSTGCAHCAYCKPCCHGIANIHSSHSIHCQGTHLRMAKSNSSPRDQLQPCGFYYLIACNILYCACSSQSRIIGYCNILIDIECARGLCQSKGSSSDSTGCAHCAYCKPCCHGIANIHSSHSIYCQGTHLRMTKGNSSPRDQLQSCGFYYLIACNILYCACSSQSRIIGYCNILIDIECARGLCQSKGSTSDSTGCAHCAYCKTCCHSIGNMYISICLNCEGLNSRINNINIFTRP